ncbi:MAG: hypothetical protein RXO32_11280, partial [Thermoproteus sp.]
MSKTENERPDYYRQRSRYLIRRYGRRLSDASWIGGEIDTGDGAVLEEHEVMAAPGEFVTLYVLYYVGDSERIIAIYDDAAVANEVARVVHEVLRLERLERRRKRRR